MPPDQLQYLAIENPEGNSPNYDNASDRSLRANDLEGQTSEYLIEMITNNSNTLKRIKYDYRNKKKAMDDEMKIKDSELEKVKLELERVKGLNKEWEAAHIDRMKRTKHESPAKEPTSAAQQQAAADAAAEKQNLED